MKGNEKKNRFNKASEAIGVKLGNEMIYEIEEK